MPCTRHHARQFRATRFRAWLVGHSASNRPPLASGVGERLVTLAGIGRQPSMRKTLSLAGSVAVSSLLGWLGSKAGIMTGFMLGAIGTGLGMYAGYRLARYLER
jgi:hypothetical protein